MPYFGRVIYSESTEGRRYNFYAPNVWMHQKDIVFPTFSIIGSHMANAHQVEKVFERVLRGELPLAPPTVMEKEEFAQGMQLVRENRHQGGLVFRFAAPKGEFRSKRAFFEAMGYEFPAHLADQTHVKVTLLPVASGKTAALLVLENKAGNDTLNREMLEELFVTMEALRDHKGVEAVLITGSGNSFVTGQDIRQLFRMAETEEGVAQARRAHQAFEVIENFPKPVVIAVNGYALGGGNELTMTGHYRLAGRGAEFGQPEVNLNLLPGYQGTQRLPSLIEAKLGDRVQAAQQAAIMILDGRRRVAEEALALGIVDEVVDDPIVRAYELIRDYVTTGRGLLAEAYRKRQALVASADQPHPLPANWTEHPEIQRIVKHAQEVDQQAAAQGKPTGRRALMEEALRLITARFSRGAKAGSELEANLFGRLVASEHGKQGMADFQNKDSLPLPPRRIRGPLEDVSDGGIDRFVRGEGAIMVDGRRLTVQEAMLVDVTLQTYFDDHAAKRYGLKNTKPASGYLLPLNSERYRYYDPEGILAAHEWDVWATQAGRRVRITGKVRHRQESEGQLVGSTTIEKMGKHIRISLFGDRQKGVDLYVFPDMLTRMKHISDLSTKNVPIVPYGLITHVSGHFGGQLYLVGETLDLLDRMPKEMRIKWARHELAHLQHPSWTEARVRRIAPYDDVVDWLRGEVMKEMFERRYLHQPTPEKPVPVASPEPQRLATDLQRVKEPIRRAILKKLQDLFQAEQNGVVATRAGREVPPLPNLSRSTIWESTFAHDPELSKLLDSNRRQKLAFETAKLFTALYEEPLGRGSEEEKLARLLTLWIDYVKSDAWFNEPLAALDREAESAKDGGTQKEEIHLSAKRAPAGGGLTAEEARAIDELIAEKMAKGEYHPLERRMLLQIVGILKARHAPSEVIEALEKGSRGGVPVHVIHLGPAQRGGLRGFPRKDGTGLLYARATKKGGAIAAINLTEAFIEDNSEKQETPGKKPEKLEKPHIVTQAILHDALEDIPSSVARRTHLEAVLEEAQYNSPETQSDVLSDLNRYILEERAARGDETYLMQLITTPYEIDADTRARLIEKHRGDIERVQRIERAAIQLSHRIRKEALRLVKIPDRDLEGKVVLVTGGGKGLGRKVALAFGRRGAGLALIGRTESDPSADEDLIRTKREIEALGMEAIYVTGDVAHREDLDQLYEKTKETFGRVDIVVNNAGVSGPVRFLPRRRVDRYRETVAIHMHTWRSIQHARALMARNEPDEDGVRGMIVNVATYFTSPSRNDDRPYPWRVDYTSAQAMKIEQARVADAELAKEGIIVTALNPGPFEGSRIDTIVYPNGAKERSLVGQEVTGEFIKKKTAAMHPDGTFMSKDDVAEAVIAMVSTRLRRSVRGSVMPFARGLDYPVPPVESQPSALGRLPDLSGKRVLITTQGDSRRVLAMVRGFVWAGAEVVVAGTETEQLLSEMNDLKNRVDVRKVNLGDESEVKALFLDLAVKADGRPLHTVIHMTPDMDATIPTVDYSPEQINQFLETYNVVPLGIVGKYAIAALVLEGLRSAKALPDSLLSRRRVLERILLPALERGWDDWTAEERALLQKGIRASTGRFLVVGPDVRRDPDAGGRVSEMEKRRLGIAQAGLRAGIASLATELAWGRSRATTNLILPGRLDGTDRGDPRAITRTALYLISEQGDKISGQSYHPDERNAVAEWTGDLKDTVAVVTGGGKNLGQKVSLSLGREGAQLVVFGRGKEALEETVAGIQALGGEADYIQGDLSRPEDIQKLFNTLRETPNAGRLDLLINNAGIGGKFATLDEVPMDGEGEWHHTLAVNFAGPWLATKQAVEMMSAQGRGGTIVNVSTFYADQPYLFRTIYTGPKALLQAMAEALQPELAEKGISMIDIAPSLVQNPRMAWVIENYRKAFAAKGVNPDDPEIRKNFFDAMVPKDPPSQAEVARAMVQTVLNPIVSRGKSHVISRWAGHPKIDRKPPEEIVSYTQKPAPRIEGQLYVLSGFLTQQPSFLKGVLTELVSRNPKAIVFVGDVETLKETQALADTTLAPAPFYYRSTNALADEKTVHRLFQEIISEFGQPDGVLHFAGRPNRESLLAYEDVFDLTENFLNPHVTSSLLVAKEALQSFKNEEGKHRQGHFVMVGPLLPEGHQPSSAFVLERGLTQLVRLMSAEHRLLLDSPEFRAFMVQNRTDREAGVSFGRLAGSFAVPHPHEKTPANRFILQLFDPKASVQDGGGRSLIDAIEPGAKLLQRIENSRPILEFLHQI